MSLSLPIAPERRRTLFYGSLALGLALLITAGIFAKNGWFPSTDSLSEKRTGWFGKPLAKNAPSSWNPIAVSSPPPTPQLSKEYIYAGSRLLAVEDANANSAPPADLAIWRPSSGQWWYLNNQGQYGAFTFGSGGDSTVNPPVPSDKPVPGDYEGDGKTDFAVYRPSTGEWWQTYSSTGNYGAVTFGGTTGDQPAPGDYDGDGKTDAAIYRPGTTSQNASFYIRNSSDSNFYAIQFGLNCDTPAPADYDGDGRADIGVWRASEHMFYSVNSSNGATQFISMGSTAAGSDVVSADYDGDGRADYAVYDRSTATWYIRQSTTGQVMTAQVTNSAANDIPVQNDYDGDGKCDIAVWRDSTGHWYINNSSGGTRDQQWGTSGDIPVPAYYRR
jgi:hypothetical protein